MNISMGPLGVTTRPRCLVVARDYLDPVELFDFPLVVLHVIYSSDFP